MKPVSGKRLLSILTAAAACIGLAAVPEAKTTYNDMSEITSHVSLKLPQRLNITRPSADISTMADAYFIMGTSDPSRTLKVNGETVTTRGTRGTFGVYVSVGSGSSRYTFSQGDDSVSVIITKGADTASAAAKISTITSMAPSYDIATTSGETMNLTCTAPAGASITATVGGQNIVLKQAASAAEGTPATFKGTAAAPSVTGTKNLGPVTYTMTYGGKTTSYRSEGSIFIAGKDARLVVQVKNNASNIYDSDSRDYFIGVARIGAVDYVQEISSSNYKLASGGWIPKETVTPLEGNVAVKNTVTATNFETTSKGENLRLTGTSHPLFRTSRDGDRFSVKLMHTEGVEQPDISGSDLFSKVTVTEEDDSTTLTFTLKDRKNFWGYDISYKNGVTTIYAKYTPSGGSGNSPLSGVTVVVDAGHGGSDPGALGVPLTTGAAEADVNLATAIAVQKRLEGLGATVVMTRTEDTDLSMNDRMTMTRQADADFFISLHSNSVGFEQNSNKSKGTEVYYYFDGSKTLASQAAEKVASYTGRTARGAKFSNYRVTLNSFCPSVLVEMGFVTNPEEYDSMTTKEGIFKTANAIGDAVVAAL